MKVFKRIIIWIIISLTIQSLGLLYLDKKIFVSSNNFKAVKVDDKKKATDKEINITENVDYKISFDGKYLSYLKDGILNIIDTKTGESKSVKTENESKILNYIWLSDRNRILFVDKESSEGKKSNFFLNYYDASKNEVGKVEKLDSLDQGAVVDSIDASTLHNVTYIKVNEKGVKGLVYRIDINHKITKMNLNSSIIGSIKVIPHVDRLIYEDDLNGNIYATNPNIRLSFTNKTKLLYIDSNDVVYVGIAEGGKISKVMYGSLDTDTGSWKTVLFDKPVDKENIFVSQKGDVMVNDMLQGIIKDVTMSKEYKYEGTYLGVYDLGIASTSQGKLIKTPFNKE
ncbi:hypothetical protein [Clostridium sp. 'White wine YQ']|uniref:hypothetical protein n=1 Tax=Clostridium sp. 'White wine YQ' TaxID=3027474 RepID=UPI0023665667|nr:hypothetical protein [Clostridium sp. 'White wine YQ']MDD7793240.1 hypothetical protein [Clostridium sp. 'White wine YQ']